MKFDFDLKDFLRRLRFYLIGVALGSVMVVFYFKDRTSVLTSWLPKHRVMWDAQHYPHSTESLHKCYLNCLQISPELWNDFITDYQVEFGRSDVRNGNRNYHFNATKSSGKIGRKAEFLKVSLRDTVVAINYVQLPSGSCGC
jgi:hypothetical protein